MPDAVLRELVGGWRHSHEEDTATETVFRPDSYAFPPSRGRIGFIFNADQTCTAIGIAARDGPAPQPCRWQILEGRPSDVIVRWPDGREQVLSIVSVDRERLVVRK
jgi:hypothetical protein